MSIGFAFAASAQDVDSMYVHLYTDSLKKGTFNYINIDGKLSNGRYVPLDSNHLEFSSSAGEFHGNSLFIDPGFSGEKVDITVRLKKNGQVRRFSMYIKKAESNAPLPTEADVLRQGRRRKVN